MATKRKEGNFCQRESSRALSKENLDEIREQETRR